MGDGQRPLPPPPPSLLSLPQRHAMHCCPWLDVRLLIVHNCAFILILRAYIMIPHVIILQLLLNLFLRFICTRIRIYGYIEIPVCIYARMCVNLCIHTCVMEASIYDLIDAWGHLCCFLLTKINMTAMNILYIPA